MNCLRRGLGFGIACVPPLPNVALVLQYLQALRVSSDTFTKEKKIKREKSFVFVAASRRFVVVLVNLGYP